MYGRMDQYPSAPRIGEVFVSGGHPLDPEPPPNVGSRLARLEVPFPVIQKRGERSAGIPALAAVSSVTARIARRGAEHDRDAFGGFEHAG